MSDADLEVRRKVKEKNLRFDDDGQDTFNLAAKNLLVFLSSSFYRLARQCLIYLKKSFCLLQEQLWAQLLVFLWELCVSTLFFSVKKA